MFASSSPLLGIWLQAHYLKWLRWLGVVGFGFVPCLFEPTSNSHGVEVGKWGEEREMMMQGAMAVSSWATLSNSIVEPTVIWRGTYLWPVWVICPVCVSPPSFWCSPSLLTGKAVWEAGKSLTWCKHCSATTKTCVISVIFILNWKRGAIPAAMKKINFVPAETGTSVKLWCLTVYF